MAVVKVLILMSDYGHDPTETAVPYAAFKGAGFDVQFATENGKPPECDKKMLEGLTGKLLGAKASAIGAYRRMASSDECQHPLSWTSPGFSLESFTIVLLPGGHDKGVRQVIDSPIVHKLIAEFFPQTKKPSTKVVAAVCHGVMVLSSSKGTDGKSVIHACNTTALPGTFESSIFWATRAFLGDYYKTYGAGSENVESSVRKALDNPSQQYKSSTLPSPFVVQDEHYNYVSARFPPDAERFAEAVIEFAQGSAAN